jgi:hypothetical protein
MYVAEGGSYWESRGGASLHFIFRVSQPAPYGNMVGTDPFVLGLVLTGMGVWRDSLEGEGELNAESAFKAASFVFSDTRT